jgi:AraC-like DNA-binding protein
MKSSELRTAYFLITNMMDELLGDTGHQWLLVDSWTVCLAWGQRELTELITESGAKTAQALSRYFGLQYSVLVSAPCTELLDIKLRYEELNDMREYCHIMDKHSAVMAYPDLPVLHYAHVREAEFRFTLDFLKEIDSLNFPRAGEVFDEYMDFLLTKAELDCKSTRNVYYGVRYILFLAVEKMRSVSDVKTEMMLMPENLRLEGSLPEIRAKFSDVFGYMANRAAEPHAPAWLGEIVKYIDKNYFDVNLNISAVAAKYDMSPEHLSKTFKRFMGVGMLDYINQVRIGEAKRLISAGNSVSKTAELVGYGSAMSMRRAFKRSEGRTPGRN